MIIPHDLYDLEHRLDIIDNLVKALCERNYDVNHVKEHIDGAKESLLNLKEKIHNESV